MAEVVRRRLQAYLDERDRPIDERGDKPGKFAYPPQLLLVDGGKGQLSAAKRVIDELDLTDEIPVAGLAKRFEEVYIPGRSRARRDPAGERGAVHAAACPRRGPPIRQHVPRRASQQADDRRARSTESRASVRCARRSWSKALGGVNAVKRADLDELQGAELPARRRRRGRVREVPPATRRSRPPHRRTEHRRPERDQENSREHLGDAARQ